MTKEEKEKKIQKTIEDIKNMGHKKLLLSPEETATMLGVSLSALYNWRSEGVGPEFIKNGNGKRARIMYPIRNIAEFMLNTQKTA